MKTIGELLTRDLTRKIEEIIKVDQADQDSVYSEITEYIATDSIKEHYGTLLKAIAETPADPHEDIGVWVSGFFGSGKSSFAKNLGYALQNRKVLNQDFSTLFKKQLDDQRVGDLLDSINARFPTEVVLFEVAKERDTRKVTERIAELMYTVLLRELDYAEDFDVAELEIELEAEGKLDHFKEVCSKLHKREWSMVRKGAQRLSRASAVLHDIEPKTYPSADSWSHAQKSQETAITVTKMVERTFELWGRRRKGKALVFIIDEVGQHVARSGDKIEDLRATVEEFGKVGKNLMKARKIVAPCWIVVTSQEKLDEVVAAIDSKRVDLAKLQDRFHYRVDLAPSDIREVATKRVLAKTKASEPILKKLFNENQGSLNASLRLERTTRRTEINEADFVQFYPYPPHYVDLCINIMSGVRLQPGAPRHYGGSNRTIIKQAYEMLVSERTDMAHKPIGTLVTLDKVYELVEGNLSNEKRTDIHEISERFKNDADDQGWALRVADIWTQDEAIGWVYQYFTPKELRDKARSESRSPRNSHEMAFRNQFFTPRYVVEFLTDNTLGRIWYEMRKGETKLKDQCRYMVRRPDEVFLSEMALDGHENVREDAVAIAKQLQISNETGFPVFRAKDEDSFDRLTNLALCVNAYETKGDDWSEWHSSARDKIESNRFDDFSTQDILDFLFVTQRADRHGGDGSVFTEPWFVNAANEVRRRVLEGRKQDATQEQLVKAPHFIPQRPKKDPRELKILDPACGSGHFLLYCFDLLHTIYEEAYSDSELGPALQQDYPTLDELKRDVPRLILAHNLHGIDIDLRASQIAALALWLRCQRAYQEMGLKKDRPKITRSNFVCAEPMPGEPAMLKEFVGQLEPRLLGQLVEVVFGKMKLAGEAGSLLKIERDIQEAVKEAKRQYDIGGISVQKTLFDKPVVKGEKRYSVQSLANDEFFERAETNVVQALTRSPRNHLEQSGRLHRKGSLCDPRSEGTSRLLPQTEQGWLLGRSCLPSFQKPPQSSDLLAAPIVQEELWPLDLLPPARQRSAIQGTGKLCRAKTSAGSQPVGFSSCPEGRRRPRKSCKENRHGDRTAGRFHRGTARLRGQVASCGEPASGTRPQRWRRLEHRPTA